MCLYVRIITTVLDQMKDLSVLLELLGFFSVSLNGTYQESCGNICENPYLINPPKIKMAKYFKAVK